MNRKMYFDFIERQLSILVYEIKRRGRLNLLDMNIHSEYFFRDFLNLLYGYDFKNMNTISQNYGGIDLFDETNHIHLGILECLNEYEWFYLNGYVRLVDRYFVVRVV